MNSILEMPIEELLEQLAKEGYRFRKQGTDEATVIAPNGKIYTVSMNGNTFPFGCSCPAPLRKCKHWRVISETIDCYHPCPGYMVRKSRESIFGDLEWYECVVSNHIVEAQIIDDRRLETLKEKQKEKSAHV